MMLNKAYATVTVGGGQAADLENFEMNNWQALGNNRSIRVFIDGFGTAVNTISCLTSEKHEM